MKSTGILLFVLVTGSLVFGCAEMPRESILAARSAIENAEKAQAAVYMEPEFKGLKDSLRAVMQDLEVENSKIIKDFSALKVRLEGIVTQTRKITAAVPARREEVETESRLMIGKIRERLETSRALLAKSPETKEYGRGLDHIENELESIVSNVTRIETSLQENVNYAEVLDELNAEHRSLIDINTELTEALARGGRR